MTYASECEVHRVCFKPVFFCSLKLLQPRMCESDYAVSETVPEYQNNNVYSLCTCQQRFFSLSLVHQHGGSVCVCVWHVDGTPATSKLLPDVKAQGPAARGPAVGSTNTVQ